MLVHTLIGSLLVISALTQASVVRATPDDSECLLSGTVMLSTGLPVPGAKLSLRARVEGESLLLVQGIAAQDGRFVLRVVQPPRSNDYMRDSFLEVEAPGLAPSVIDRVYLPTPSYDLGPIFLSPPVELRGRVTTNEGKPIAGAQIHAALGRAMRPYGDHSRQAPVAVTSASGDFTCRSLPPGLVTLGVSAPGFADVVCEPRILSAAAPNGLEVVLHPERIIQVTVTSRRGGIPLVASIEPIGEIQGSGPYVDETSYLAFWRGRMDSDSRGVISIPGVDRGFAGYVLVSAKDYRPELVRLDGNAFMVSLQPVRWIEVTASRAGGQPVPELYSVNVRDGKTPPSWCGNCDDYHRIELWKDSRAVEVLAPNRWRIAWNSSACYVDGGRPESVFVTLTDGSRQNLELPDTEPSARCDATLTFDAPAQLSGVVRTADGKPVSMRLGIQLSMRRDDMLSVVSDQEGKFRFDALDAGPEWLYSMEDVWKLASGGHEVELVAGELTQGVVVVARSEVSGKCGRVRGKLSIAGRPPGKPVLLALDEVPNQHLPDAYPRGFAWTDREGNFEIGAPWPRAYHIVPKHEPANTAGGWRDFAGEIPAHDERWPWEVVVPESGTNEVTIDLPDESQWDGIAPPKGD